MCMRDLFELTQCEQSLTAHGFLRILFSMKTQKRRKYKYWNISNSKFIAINSSNVFCDNFSLSHDTNSLAASLNCKMSWKARRHTSDDRSINSCCVAIFQLQYARMHFTPHSSSRTSKNERRRTQRADKQLFCLHFILFYCFRLRIEFSTERICCRIVRSCHSTNATGEFQLNSTTFDNRPETNEMRQKRGNNNDGGKRKIATTNRRLSSVWRVKCSHSFYVYFALPDWSVGSDAQRTTWIGKINSCEMRMQKRKRHQQRCSPFP